MSVAAYHALKPSDAVAHTQSVLDGIANAMPFTLTEGERKTLVQDLLDDVRSPSKRIGVKNVAAALNTVKMLGRQPVIAQVIAQSQNLDLLATTISSQDSQVAFNAMRVVANTLFLVLDSVLDKWTATSGPVAAINVLKSRHEPEPIFLASRILFLTTAKSTPFIKEAVETHALHDVVAQTLGPAVQTHLSGAQWAKDGLIDQLKVAFNLLLHYPRLIDAEINPDSPPKTMGEGWNPKLEPLLVPILRAFYVLEPASPPSAPLVAPMTHTINGLINLPVAQYAHVWFNLPETASSPVADSPPHDSVESSSAGGHKERERERHGLQRVFNLLPRRSSSKQRRDSAESSSRLSVSNSSGRPSMSSRPSSPLRTSSLPPPEGDVARKAYDLLEAVLAWYFPNSIDPDDPSVRERCTREDVQLDHVVSPLLIFMQRLAAGHSDTKSRLRQWLLPADLDRSGTPLEERADTLGRCLRLLKCVYFARAKETTGELLWTLCDADARTLTSAVGYGNVAGFLFNRGIVAPPPSSSSSSSDTASASIEEINPITGMKVEDGAASAGGSEEMTDEEKEREAEKLFVLFDRLERTGVGVQNPFRKAFEEGKIQYP